MTVDRRPVASRRPKSVGDRGLLRVARHDSPGVLPPPTRSDGLLPIRSRYESGALLTEVLGFVAAV
jgi:hypothetical protein